MDLSKLGYYAKPILKFLLLVIFFIVWFFDYFEEAFEEYRTKAITTVVRNEKGQHLVSPTILICSNTAFKPSMDKQYQFNFPMRFLFWVPQDNQQVSNLFRNQSVSELFYNFSYAKDLTFSSGNFIFEPAVNHLENKGENYAVIELKIIPTIFLGTCHIIDVLQCKG